MRKCLLVLLLSKLLVLTVVAQKITFSPLSGFSPAAPLLLVGKYGVNTFLFEHRGDTAYDLVLLDDSLHPIARMPWADIIGKRRLYASEFISKGDNAAFISQHRDSTELKAMVAQWDTKGTVKQISDLTLGTWDESRSQALNFYETAAAADGSYYLFYKSRMILTSDTFSFKGLMFDRNWEVVREVSLKAPFDREAQVFIDALVDSKGNIHLLFSNNAYDFRLSTHVNIYSWYHSEKSVTSRDILIKNRKLKDLQVTEDTASGALRFQALYMEENSKDISGIALGSVPLEGSVASTAYYPFDHAFRNAMRKNIPGARSANVLNTISLMGFHSGSGGATVYAQLDPFSGGNFFYRTVSYGGTSSTTNVFTDSWRESSLINKDYKPNSLSPIYGVPGIPPGSTYNVAAPYRGIRVGLFALRIDSTNQLRFQQWTTLAKDMRRFGVMTLPLQKDDAVSFVTYIHTNNGATKLIGCTLSGRSSTANTTIDLPKGVMLQLGNAVRLGDAAYLIPYADQEKGLSGIGLLRW